MIRASDLAGMSPAEKARTLAGHIQFTLEMVQKERRLKRQHEFGRQPDSTHQRLYRPRPVSTTPVEDPSETACAQAA